MRKRLLPFLSLMVFWIGLNQAAALANPCWGRMTPNEESKIADMVFAGKVIVANQQVWWGERIRVSRYPPFIHLPNGNVWHRSTFEVTKVWKGDITARTSIIHSIAFPDVSYSFRQGEEYIVYAKKFDRWFYTTGCFRNNLLSAAGEDLLAFGAGKPPIPNPSLLGDLIQRLVVLFLFLGLIGWAFWSLWLRYGGHKS